MRSQTGDEKWEGEFYFLFHIPFFYTSEFYFKVYDYFYN